MKWTWMLGVMMWMAVMAVAMTSAAAAGPGKAEPGAVEPSRPDASKVKISQVQINAVIEGSNLTVGLDFQAQVKADQQEIALIRGPVVLDSLAEPVSGHLLRYDRQAQTYYLGWRRAGRWHVSATFAARPEPVAGAGGWRQARFALPDSTVRHFQVQCDRTDLQVELPGAMQVQRRVEQGRLVVTAIAGPGKPFVVRWKPQVQPLEAKLVVSCQANTVATVSAAALRVDSLFLFNVAQGRLEQVELKLPGGLNVTQVQGKDLRDWTVEAGPGGRRLKVWLVRPQQRTYALHVLGEQALPPLPCKVKMPVIGPAGSMRTSGHVVVGTSSAIRLQVGPTAGLSQIDAKAFPRVAVEGQAARPIPSAKAFYYSFAAPAYQMELELEDIVPSYDAQGLMAVTVKEDDLVIESVLNLEVRDAPIRQVELTCPPGYLVATVGGSLVTDYQVRGGDGEAGSRVTVQFGKPVQGATNLQLRLERGSGPLDQAVKVGPIRVAGARNQRGQVVVAAEQGVQLATPQAEQLREVNLAQVELNVPGGRLAYKYRQADWSLTLEARRKPAGVRAESFHLISLGEGRLYGSVAVSYYITGSPIDRLQFRVPQSLEHVQFIGRDVRRTSRQGDLWTVHLQRKVIGDYNLGVRYDLPYQPGKTITVGSVTCQAVDTATGYLAITSQLNLQLDPVEPAGQTAAGQGLMEISREEIPANYRLLARPPVLKAYKYVGSPHQAALQVRAYDRGQVIEALVEVMDAVTRLAVQKDNPIEAVTTVRYKVKNTSSQFLRLHLPEGATVWATRLVEPGQDDRQGRTHRLTASYDRQQGLMIPLPRPRDPNQPITIELEYGQVLERPGWWRSRVALEAPRSGVPATFAGWTVQVNDDYAVRPAEGGNMAEQQDPRRPGDLAWVLGCVLRAWAQAGQRLAERWPAVVVVFLVVVMVMSLLAGLFHRPALAWVPVGGLVCGLLLVGLLAAAMPAFSQVTAVDRMTEVDFVRPVNADAGQALRVEVWTIPAWRRHVPMSTVVAGPVLLLVLSVLAWRVRRGRAALAAAAVAVACYGLAQFSVLAMPLAWLMSLGPGLAGLAWLVRRWRARAGGEPGSERTAEPTGPDGLTVAGAVVLMVLAGGLGGCGGGRSLPIQPISRQPVLEQVDCQLTAGADAMAMTCRVKVSAPRPGRLDLFDASAVLMSREEPAEHVQVVLEDGRWMLKIAQAGVYEVTMQFLAPLDKADEQQQRRFEMALPPSLSNRVSLTVEQADMEIVAPSAWRFEQSHEQGRTVAQAMFEPGGKLAFAWRPRVRHAELEQSRFFGQVTSVVQFDTGLVEAHHRVGLQIAQGQVKQLVLSVPDNMTVTSVAGRSVGAWRYDPAGHRLEVHLDQAVSGAYELAVVTQAAESGTPYRFVVKPMVIEQAQRQWNLVALVHSGSVYLSAESEAQRLNVDDVAREQAAMLGRVLGRPAPPWAAYRLAGPEQAVTVAVAAVEPEVRAEQAGRFEVSDQALCYQGRLTVRIDKAGLFALQLRIPAEYEIDLLQAQQSSHWEEKVDGAWRVAWVYFAQKRQGVVTIDLALSRPVGPTPQRLTVPQVQVVGAVKHTGQLVVWPVRGVRLSVAERQGLSEFNPAEVNVRQAGAMAFRLLRPDWSLVLVPEVLEPVVSSEFVHVAHVTEGMVRHSHYLWYRVRHAGVKVLKVRVPAGVLGLTMRGPSIARRRQVEPGLWEVELEDKWFDRPYLLRVDYHRLFDRSQGKVQLEPVEPVDADQVHGHVVIFTSERIELADVQPTGPSALEVAEARNISAKFAAGDLSGAAFCYAVPGTEYRLTLSARRHAAADQLKAEVRSAALTSVVSRSGQSLTQVRMEMMVGSKRHLRVMLPERSQLWSVLVNGQAAVPWRPPASGQAAGQEGATWLIPLAQAAVGDLPVTVELVYVSLDRVGPWAGRRQFDGPRFDLPLKDIRWTMYVPEGFDYDDFEGTLGHVDQPDRPVVMRYGLAQYEQTISRSLAGRKKKAAEYQTQARRIAAEQGRFNQFQARQMLEQARSWSLSDRALNEDISVDLDNLLRRQAKAGLVGNRLRLRLESAGVSPTMPAGAPEDLDGLSNAQVQTIESKLTQADNENLDLIARRLIEVMETAVPDRIQLTVQVPCQGRLLQFARPLLVEPDSRLTVRFNVRPQVTRQVDRGVLWAGGLFVAMLAAMGLAAVGGRRLGRVAQALASRQDRARSGRLDRPDAMDAAQDGLSDAEPVSASELNLPQNTQPDAPQPPASRQEPHSPPDRPADTDTDRPAHNEPDEPA